MLVLQRDARYFDNVCSIAKYYWNWIIVRGTEYKVHKDSSHGKYCGNRSQEPN